MVFIAAVFGQGPMVLMLLQMEGGVSVGIESQGFSQPEGKFHYIVYGIDLEPVRIYRLPASTENFSREVVG